MGQGQLDPLLARAWAFEVGVCDVCALVDADAQTHDEEQQRDDVQLQPAELDVHVHDREDVDHGRADQGGAKPVAEHGLQHTHDGRGRAEDELDQFGQDHAVECVLRREGRAVHDRVGWAEFGQFIRRVHYLDAVRSVGSGLLERNSGSFDRVIPIECQLRRDRGIQGP